MDHQGRCAMTRSKDRRFFARFALDYLQNPKVSRLYRTARKTYGLDGQQLADQAVIAHMASVLYSRSSLTDGELFPEDAFSIARTRDRDAVDELLLDVGLWEEDGDGRRVHDYSEHQDLKADVERRSEASAKANRARWSATHSGSESGSDTRPQSGSDSRGEERRGEESGGSGKRRATRLRDDWEPSTDSPANRRAVEKHSRQWLDNELTKFRNYWTSQPDSRARKTNWDRTWQNWVLNSRTPDEQMPQGREVEYWG
jgi:hypothetical protein